jgi:hypothetical protein
MPTGSTTRQGRGAHSHPLYRVGPRSAISRREADPLPGGRNGDAINATGTPSGDHGVRSAIPGRPTPSGSSTVRRDRPRYRPPCGSTRPRRPPSRTPHHESLSENRARPKRRGAPRQAVRDPHVGRRSGTLPDRHGAHGRATAEHRARRCVARRTAPDRPSRPVVHRPRGRAALRTVQAGQGSCMASAVRGPRPRAPGQSEALAGSLNSKKVCLKVVDRFRRRSARRRQMRTAAELLSTKLSIPNPRSATLPDATAAVTAMHPSTRFHTRVRYSSRSAWRSGPVRGVRCGSAQPLVHVDGG